MGERLATKLLTFENSVTPVWVGQEIFAFVVSKSEAALERECTTVVSDVKAALHTEWEVFRSMRDVRNEVKQKLKTK